MLHWWQFVLKWSLIPLLQVVTAQGFSQTLGNKNQQWKGWLLNIDVSHIKLPTVDVKRPHPKCWIEAHQVKLRPVCWLIRQWRISRFSAVSGQTLQRQTDLLTTNYTEDSSNKSGRHLQMQRAWSTNSQSTKASEVPLRSDLRLH